MHAFPGPLVAFRGVLYNDGLSEHSEDSFPRSAFLEPHPPPCAHLPCAQPADMRWKTVALVAMMAFLAMHDLCVAEVCIATPASVLAHASLMQAACRSRGRVACLLRQDTSTAAELLLLLLSVLRYAVQPLAHRDDLATVQVEAQPQDAKQVGFRRAAAPSRSSQLFNRR